MLADKRNPSQTLAEIFAELEEEGMEKGIEKGKEETAHDIAKELIRENFPNEKVSKLTKLELEEVVELRKSLQS